MYLASVAEYGRMSFRGGKIGWLRPDESSQARGLPTQSRRLPEPRQTQDIEVHLQRRSVLCGSVLCRDAAAVIRSVLVLCVVDLSARQPELNAAFYRSKGRVRRASSPALVLPCYFGTSC